MNYRLFLFLVAMSSLVYCVAPITAARLPVSTVTVTVLSADLTSYERHDYHHESFVRSELTRDWYEEKTTYVVKARIDSVVFNDHDLALGAVIDIKYEASGGSAPIYARTTPLNVKAGETWTVAIFGAGTAFEARDWKRSTPEIPPPSSLGGKQ